MSQEACPFQSPTSRFPAWLLSEVLSSSLTLKQLHFFLCSLSSSPHILWTFHPSPNLPIPSTHEQVLFTCRPLCVAPSHPGPIYNVPVSPAKVKRISTSVWIVQCHRSTWVRIAMLVAKFVHTLTVWTETLSLFWPASRGFSFSLIGCIRHLGDRQTLGS